MTSLAPTSEEVASDFEDSLKDLQMNNRYEISNLTIIAKENTEHAQAISEVLEKHIKKTPPQRKLPALYVLDSIVKNVGSPYPVYLGRNLFSTFMDAYQLVDPATRRNMESMLKTWKEGVPGSADMTPVFPLDVTKRIENALIKAKTAAVQSQQNQARIGRSPFPLPQRPMPSPSIPHNDTPTPPQNGMYSAPTSNLYQAQYGQYAGQQVGPIHYGQHNINQFTPNQQIPQFAPPPDPSVDPNRLLGDIGNLIKLSQAEWSMNINDSGVQKRLQALLELQKIVQTQSLPHDQLRAIQDQLSQLSGQSQPQQHSSSNLHPPYLQQQAQQPTNRTFSPQPYQQQQHQAPPQQASLPQGLDMSLVAQLLGSQTPTQIGSNAMTPGLSFAPPQSSTPLDPGPTQAMPAASTPQPANTGNPLLDALKSAGLVGLTPPTSTPIVQPSIPVPPSSIVQQLSVPPTQQTAPPSGSRNDVELSTASLKIPRNRLYILNLIEALPNQCSTCGRRFAATDDGRTRKQRHLDWHFRTNQRMGDAARRGQNRAFYSDEMSWIKTKEIDESADPTTTTTTTAAGAGAGGASATSNLGAVAAAGSNGATTRGGSSGASTDPKLKFILVPPDAAATKPKCPICQEEWKSIWKDEVQDWVWMDAVKVGGRIFHATCHEEVSRGWVGGGGGGMGILGTQPPKRDTPTPDKVLGKRKGESPDSRTVRAKLKEAAA
ncbi:MAG: hypothetical protein M1820_002203 [Bogoriella megaspora]|nr:MAG: hypothetical protein M1820_002203 [Bogoriella megaspora]